MNTTRTQEVDALRSLALFGICVVNLPFLGQPIDVLMLPPTALEDRLTTFVVELLFQGKFFVLFSFLFGWGFGAQLASAERRGAWPGAPYFRRLLGLLLIGMGHAVLIFFGDILVLYAFLGLALWPLRNKRPKTLVRAAAVLVVVAAITLFLLAAVLPTEGTTANAVSETSGYLGSFPDAVRQRISDWQLAFPFIFFFNGPIALAAFLSGLAAYKTGFFEAESYSYGIFDSRLRYLIAPAILCNIAYAAAVSGLLGQGWLAASGFAMLAIGGPSLSALYLSAIVRLARSGLLGASHTAAGRMSLTAYVAEGAIAGLIFNGYGFSQYNRAGAFELFALASLVFLIVHSSCRVWLTYANYGPLEALLRWITRGSGR
jgi:uncharacterized protein